MTPEEIKSNFDLKEFLLTLPEERQKQTSVIIAHRIAMRLLPLMAFGHETFSKDFDLMTFAVLRAHAISRVAIAWPTLEITDTGISIDDKTNAYARTTRAYLATVSKNASDSVSAKATAANATALAADATLAVTFAFNAVESTEAAALVADSANLASLASDFASGNLNSDVASALWENIRIDARAIAGNGITNLLAQPLWQTPPATWLSQTANLRSSLALLDGEAATGSQPWQVWWAWYAPIVEGQTPWGLPPNVATALERRIALGDNRKGFWDRDPHVVTAEIYDWVEEARASFVGASEQDSFEDIVEDLHSRAASIETVVRDGRVDVLHHAPNADISRSTLQSAVNDLASALKDMASSARAANADSRTCNFIEDLSTVVSDMLDDQTKLFQAARGAKALENYAPTVNAEWNSLAAAQYLSLVAQFDETLRKFPAWREFRKSKPVQVQPLDVRKADEGFRSFVKGLRDHAAFVANAVYGGLENLGHNLGKFAKKADDLAEEARHLEGQGELLLADVATSISNILQSGAKLVYGLCLKPFGDGVKETLPSESKKLGENIVKWTFRGGPLAAFAAAFPDVFSWLGSFAQWLKNLKG